MFDLAIGSKLRGCDVVKIKIGEQQVLRGFQLFLARRHYRLSLGSISERSK
jgi:hypothetical protein